MEHRWMAAYTYAGIQWIQIGIILGGPQSPVLCTGMLISFFSAFSLFEVLLYLHNTLMGNHYNTASE